MTVDGARNVHRRGPRHALVRALCLVNVTIVAGKNEVYEAKNYLWNGAPIYTNVKAPHGTWTFWVKEIDQDGKTHTPAL